MRNNIFTNNKLALIKKDFLGLAQLCLMQFFIYKKLFMDTPTISLNPENLKNSNPFKIYKINYHGKL